MKVKLPIFETFTYQRMSNGIPVQVNDDFEAGGKDPEYLFTRSIRSESIRMRLDPILLILVNILWAAAYILKKASDKECGIQTPVLL
jgi:hypothetical protein